MISVLADWTTIISFIIGAAIFIYFLFFSNDPVRRQQNKIVLFIAIGIFLILIFIFIIIKNDLFPDYQTSHFPAIATETFTFLINQYQEPIATLKSEEPLTPTPVPTSTFQIITVTSTPPTNTNKTIDENKEFFVESVLPNNDDIANSEKNNIWSLTNFIDDNKPVIIHYPIEVNFRDRWRLGFRWCGSDKENLDQIIRPFKITYFINGNEIPAQNIYTWREWVTDLGYCYRTSTMLTNWKIGSTGSVEMRYELFSSIYDGERWYYAGVYRHILDVTVRD